VSYLDNTGLAYFYNKLKALFVLITANLTTAEIDEAITDSWSSGSTDTWDKLLALTEADIDDAIRNATS